MQSEGLFSRFGLGATLAHAEIFRSGGNSLPCGIARAAPWTRLAEKKSFPNLGASASPDRR